MTPIKRLQQSRESNYPGPPDEFTRLEAQKTNDERDACVFCGERFCFRRFALLSSNHHHSEFAPLSTIIQHLPSSSITSSTSSSLLLYFPSGEEEEETKGRRIDRRREREDGLNTFTIVTVYT